MRNTYFVQDEPVIWLRSTLVSVQDEPVIWLRSTLVSVQDEPMISSSSLIDLKNNKECTVCKKNSKKEFTQVIKIENNIIAKMKWSENDNLVVSKSFLEGKDYRITAELLPHLKERSIFMKYKNYLYLQQGNVKG